VVIDPLIDGVTGTQSVATRSMGERLVQMMREHYPQYDVQPFSAANVARGPLVLIGTLTGVNAQRQASGERQAYRICLALADLRSGKLVGRAWPSLCRRVDPTPLPFFRTRRRGPTTRRRTATSGPAREPRRGIRSIRCTWTASWPQPSRPRPSRTTMGRYREALDLYASVLAMPSGRQLRALNGLYLTNWKLGRREQAAAAFAGIVDFGLEHRRLAVKFLFRPGSTAFVRDRKG
jgi:hypothetical protein